MDLDSFVDTHYEFQHVDETFRGHFELKAIPSNHPEPSRPIPKKVSVTIAKFQRVGDIYFKYVGMLEQGFQEDRIGAWMMTDKEKYEFTRLGTKLEQARMNLIRSGFVVRNEKGVPKEPKELDISNMDPNHPMFSRYLQAQDTYDDFFSKLQAEVAGRQITSDEQYKLDLVYRFQIDIFIHMTSEMVGNKLVKYSQEELQNDPYWMDQIDLISEVFYMTLRQYVAMIQEDKKKFDLIQIEALKLISMVNSEDETEKSLNFPSTTSSGSSETSIQQRLEGLENL